MCTSLESKKTKENSREIRYFKKTGSTFGIMALFGHFWGQNDVWKVLKRSRVVTNVKIKSWMF